MLHKLGDIAKINFGSYEKPTETGNVKYLHSSHFDKLFQPNHFSESFVELDAKNEKYLLKPNDVILAGKGQRIFAWAYHKSFGATIPSSLFYIIRLNSSAVIGEYLAQYLNTEKMQHKLKLIGAGATIISIPKKELEQIKISIPTIDEQKKIVNCINQIDENIHLTKKLLEHKFKLKKGILNKLIN